MKTRDSLTKDKLEELLDSMTAGLPREETAV